MQKIVIGTSRTRVTVLLIGSLCFVAAGVLILATGANPLVAWSCIVFFGGCSVVAAGQLRDHSPRMVIDDAGIFDRTLKVGVIAWDDIENAWVQQIQNQPFICLELRDPAKYLDRLSPVMRRVATLNEKLGFTPLSLNLSSTGADADQLHALIMLELATRRGAAQA